MTQKCYSCEQPISRSAMPAWWQEGPKEVPVHAKLCAPALIEAGEQVRVWTKRNKMGANSGYITHNPIQ